MARIFVYGTLKSGGENHRFLDNQTLLAPARTAPEYKLYELEGYPGLVAAPDGGVAVEGELWEVDEDCLRRIDVLEGLSIGLYRREPVRLAAPHEAAAAETYLYAGSIEGRPELGAVYAAQPRADVHDPIGRHPRRTTPLASPPSE